MSLILDALNRSQRERDNRDSLPGIQTQHKIESLPALRSWHGVLPWLGLVFAMLVIAWLLFGGTKDHLQPMHEVLPEEVPEEVSGQAQVREETFVTKESAIVLHSAPHSKLSQKTNNEKSELEASQRSDNSAVKELYKQEVREQPVIAVQPDPIPAQRVEQVVDIDKMIALAAIEAKNTALAEHSAPFLADLSQQAKDQIPTIYYTRHDYSTAGSRSTVTLNGEVVQEGGTLAGGITVDEVLPDSVILSHRGVQFRLRALNSWVNL